MDGSSDPPIPRPDLRSRKRAAAIDHIQRVALGLFDEHGYDKVSIAQIADAAEVGERSVYRYFGSKPMLILYDEADVASLDALAERLRTLPLLDAVSQSLDDIAGLLSADRTDHARRRLRHVDLQPELRAALAGYVWDLGSEFAATIAAARRVPGSDLTAQIHGHCIVAALTAAIDRWRREPVVDLAIELRAAIEILAEGFGPLRSR